MSLIAANLLALLALTPAAPAEGSAWDRWQFQAEIEALPAGDAARFVRVGLTPELLSQADPDWSDLRLVDDSGVERPFVLQSLEDRVFETLHPLNIINQGTADGFQQVVCDLGEEPSLSNQIRLETAARNFHFRVQVLGSPDAAEWLLLRDRIHVFHHEDPEASNYRVSFPDTSYRYLKLILWLEGNEPISISAVRVARVDRREVPVEQLEARVLAVSQNPDRRSTDLELDLTLPNQHLTRARLEVDDDNFRRSAEFAFQDEQGRWVPAGAGSIYRFTAEETVEQRLEIPLSDFNHRRARLRIWNADSPPLAVRRVLFERPPHVLIFRAEPGRPYWLLAGNPEAYHPNYDLDLAVRRLDVLDLPQIRLGPVTANPNYRPSVPELPWTERYPVLLWAGLAAGGLLLLWLLRRTLRDLESPAPGDSD